jgi:C1A family cysteine protease
MEERTTFGLGWVPELPDLRDYLQGSASVGPLLAKTGARRALGKGARKGGPGSVDLRRWCSPIENQGSLGSCTAHAAVGLVEYFERRAFAKHIDASRLFVYKVTRDLLHWTGDQGAYLRTAMKALVLFGAPPEEYWPYRVSEFDKEPPSFCYALASNYKAVQYFRLDPNGGTPAQALASVKSFLAAGYPSMFGFTVYSSIWDAAGGKIPYPTASDRVDGGHAVVAIGYDDAMTVGRLKGALLIRNSWGPGWGVNGYGWLPYAYVADGLADDFWSVVSQSWVDTGNFT